MSFSPTNACVLICPKGLQYGSISSDQWDSFVAADDSEGGKLQIVGPDVFGLYFSNVKQYTIRYQRSIDSFDQTYTLEQAADFAADGFETINTGVAPWPQNNWSTNHDTPANAYSTDEKVLYHVGQSFTGIRYYQSDDTSPYGIEDLGNPEAYILFNFFIYHGNLYCFVPFRFASPAVRTVTINTTHIEIHETLAGNTTTVTMTPTQQYY